MIDAVQFIPHEKPMVFVDHLIEANEHFAIAELVIRPELMFCEAEGLPTWTSIELMAQTISAYAGHKGKSVRLTTENRFFTGYPQNAVARALFCFRGNRAD